MLSIQVKHIGKHIVLSDAENKKELFHTTQKTSEDNAVEAWEWVNNNYNDFLLVD